MTITKDTRPSRRRAAWVRRSSSIALAAALLTAACGSSAEPISSQSAEPGEVAAATTEPETTDSTEPLTDSEADDQTELAEEPVVEQDYEQDPIADDQGQSLVDLAYDIAGPTDDISRELNRVAVAPTIRTPSNGAYLVGFRISSELARPKSPSNPAPSDKYGSSIYFLAKESVEDLRTFYETLFIADGWEVTEVEESRAKDGVTTSVSLAKDGDLSTVLDLSLIDLEKFDATAVEMRFLFLSETIAPAATERLGQWAAGVVPANTEIFEATVRGSAYDYSSDFKGQYGISSKWASESSDDDLVAEIKAHAAASGLEYSESKTGVFYEPTDELPRISVSGNNNRVEVSRTKDGAGNIDPADVISWIESGGQGSDEDTDRAESAPFNPGTLSFATTSDPLGDNASPSEIEDAITDVVGPTDDASEAMARFGHFPAIATPDNAEITNISAQIGEVILSDDDLRAEVNTVTLEVPEADQESLEVFYQAELAGDGWEQVGRQDNASRESVELSYDIDGTNPSTTSEPLVIELKGGVQEGIVVITYLHIFPVEEVNLERWSGWYGSLPLLPDGELRGLGVSNFDTGREKQINFYIDYAYSELSDDAPDQIIALLPGSDYKLGPEPEVKIGEGVGLDHPDFDSVQASPVARWLEFRMQRIS